jgi:hypothetical protein
LISVTDDNRMSFFVSTDVFGEVVAAVGVAVAAAADRHANSNAIIPPIDLPTY